jgi:uncharacterized protein (UPF0335 family)
MKVQSSNAETVLRQRIADIESLLEDRKAINTDIREIYASLKEQNFNPKIVRKIITLRAMDRETRRQEEQQFDEYKAAVGLG